MRVFYYGVFNSGGGLENFARNLILNVREKRSDIKFTILAISDDFSYKEEFIKAGCDVAYLPNSHKHPFKFYSKLLNILKTGKKGDLIQLNLCSYRNLMLLKACKKSGLPVITVGHYTQIPKKGLFSAFGSLHYRNRSKFANLGPLVTNSDGVTNFMFSANSHPIFIDNGIDPVKFAFDPLARKKIRNKLGIAENQILLGQIGRVATDKNQIFSVKLLEKLKTNGLNCKLAIVGKEVSKEPREYAEAKGLKGDVIFTGPIFNNLAGYYSAFDFCLLPSLNEGMSLSLLELSCNGVTTLLSSAVPHLKIDMPSLHYFDLNLNDWEQYISDNADNLPVSRENRISGTVYDLNVCVSKYIGLYEKTGNGE